MDETENIFFVKLSFPLNKDNFHIIIEDLLKNQSYLDKKMQKNILICLIELIQNIFKHNILFKDNIFNQIDIECKLVKNKPIVKISQIINQEQLLNLTNIINKINNISLEEIKGKYIKNLENNDSENLGNGLLLCKLKSQNNIDFNSCWYEKYVLMNLILTFKNLL